MTRKSKPSPHAAEGGTGAALEAVAEGLREIAYDPAVEPRARASALAELQKVLPWLPGAPLGMRRPLMGDYEQDIATIREAAQRGLADGTVEREHGASLVRTADMALELARRAKRSRELLRARASAEGSVRGGEDG